ncbi:MAG TPA: alkaline phosphatase family protein [Geminicoccaceae bacterium]|nr:alkaline phosphatase family protein [Geminicoccaceae bacterium]
MSAAAPGRILVIGLELGDGRLVYEWAKAGHLPTIAALIEDGTWGWLETTAGQLHVSAWPSIYTGVGPGEHGVYYTFQPAPGLQGYQRFHEGLYGRPTFWQLLDAAGRRCTIFDAPYTHPEPGFAGTQLFDWGTWAHYLAPQSTPRNLLRELESACGKYPLGLEAHDLGFRPLDPADTQQRLIGAVRRKAEAALWLMRRSDVDLFMTVFGETHVAAHYCWSPDGDHDLMRGLYEELDRAIERLLQAAGPDALIVVVSGDAVAPNHTGWYLLPEVLARLGYFASAEMAAAPGGAGAEVATRFDPVRAVRDLLPKDFRKNLARLLPTGLRDKLAQRVDTATFDWSRTTAYCLPTDLEGCIRINLEGREPEGRVAPGAEYEKACRDLKSALEELVEPDTGRCSVREVLIVDQAFPGPRRGHLPDLIVLWDAAAPITALASERIGTVGGESPDPRPGTHAEPGFVLMRGSGIAAGRTIQDAHIFDVAPTILDRLGVAPPAHMTGRRLAKTTTVQ